MPDHPVPSDDDPEGPAVPHDDIMKRLLDYQRHMREGEPSEDAPESTFGEPSPPETSVTESVDVAPAEVDFGALEETPTHDEPAFDAPAAATQGVEVEEEEAPAAPRRGIFRSGRAARSSRRDADDIPELEDATNLRDVPDFGELGPATAPLSGSVAAELEVRIAGFERTLERLQSQVVELRRTFADMAIAADERLGVIEETIAKARAERFS